MKKEIEFEMRVLLRWVKMYQRKEKEVWYRDARDHIEKLAKLLKVKLY
jgi:hypothetical protein